MDGNISFILECLEHREAIFTTKFQSITYFLPKEAEAANWPTDVAELSRRFPFVKIKYGLPQTTDTFENERPKLWIIDELLSKEVCKSPEMERLFSRDSHHQDITVMFSVSNAYAARFHWAG